MTFDPSGNLWTTTWTGETVVEFTKAQLRNTGSPRPVVTIQIDDEGGLRPTLSGHNSRGASQRRAALAARAGCGCVTFTA